MEELQYHLLAEVEDRHWWHRTLRRAVVEALARHLPADAGRRSAVLDLGCGTGGLLAAAAGRYQVFGADLSPLALAYCRRRGLPRLAAASAVALPFAAGSFDAVVAIDVLSHRSIASDAGAAREIARVLRPGGLSILQLSAFEGLRGAHDESVYQARRYTRRQVAGLLDGAGLRLLESRYRLAFLPPLMVVNNLWTRLRGGARRPDLALPSAPLNRLLGALARLDLRLAARAPFGSSIFCVGRLEP